MDVELLSFEYRTENPEDLENFLSEVLQLDIKTSTTGLFSVQFGNIHMHVLRGESVPTTFQLALSFESFTDLPARWEFFTFRYNEKCTASFETNQAIFKNPNGVLWRVMAAPTIARHENSEIPVRNF